MFLVVNILAVIIMSDWLIRIGIRMYHQSGWLFRIRLQMYPQSLAVVFFVVVVFVVVVFVVVVIVVLIFVVVVFVVIVFVVFIVVVFIVVVFEGNIWIVATHKHHENLQQSNVIGIAVKVIAGMDHNLCDLQHFPDFKRIVMSQRWLA